VPGPLGNFHFLAGSPRTTSAGNAGPGGGAGGPQRGSDPQPFNNLSTLSARTADTLLARGRTTCKPAGFGLARELLLKTATMRTRGRLRKDVVLAAAGRRPPQGRRAGFTLAELLVVIAIVGILALVSAPSFISYLRSARLRGAAETVAAFVNQGRQVAISGNQFVCVQVASSTMTFRTSPTALNVCSSGTLWIGAGTSSTGARKVPDGVTLTANASPVFGYLGTATPAATYTVTDGSSSKKLSVVVAASGRVSIGP
jgi:prepilin-type N-terminal cleavage/methylation domain-containing protein